MESVIKFLEEAGHLHSRMTSCKEGPCPSSRLCNLRSRCWRARASCAITLRLRLPLGQYSDVSHKTRLVGTVLECSSRPSHSPVSTSGVSPSPNNRSLLACCSCICTQTRKRLLDLSSDYDRSNTNRIRMTGHQLNMQNYKLDSIDSLIYVHAPSILPLK